jgi:hypothetical protein
LGVSQIYAYAICDYDYLKPIVPSADCPAGRYLAEREITISTSAFLSKKDLTLVVNF